MSSSNNNDNSDNDDSDNNDSNNNNNNNNVKLVAITTLVISALSVITLFLYHARKSSQNQSRSEACEYARGSSRNEGAESVNLTGPESEDSISNVGDTAVPIERVSSTDNMVQMSTPVASTEVSSSSDAGVETPEDRRHITAELPLRAEPFVTFIEIPEGDRESSDSENRSSGDEQVSR